MYKLAPLHISENSVFTTILISFVLTIILLAKDPIFKFDYSKLNKHNIAFVFPTEKIYYNNYLSGRNKRILRRKGKKY